MNVLILGASGLVGGNCLRHFSKKGHHCLGTHFGFETDQTVYYNTLEPADDRNKSVEAFEADVVVHCGALTWVDYCENHPDESHEKTVVSTKNALELASDKGAHFVYLSTDYVFDGKHGFYTETDACNPLNVYGKHKLEAEQLVKESGLDHLICRITNVYGDEIRGKNFIARLVNSINQDERLELKLPVDQYATPVNACDVARAVEVLLSNNKSGTYHFASTDYLNRLQLAERVAKHFSTDLIGMEAVKTATLNQSALRPLNGGMSAAKFNEEFPDFGWTNVDDYLTSLSDRK